jgi:hypothetical protein
VQLDQTIVEIFNLDDRQRTIVSMESEAMHLCA